MSSILVSVVIPTYNSKSRLIATLNSVRNQTYTNFECIIVDDGSTDTTLSLVRDYAEEDKRFRNIVRVDGPKGANRCRNIGILNSCGEFVALLDSDDEFPSDYIEGCLRFVNSSESIQASYSGAIIDNGIRQREKPSRAFYPNESPFDFLLSKTGFAPTPSLFFKRHVGLDNLFDETILRHQDWEFFIRSSKQIRWTYRPGPMPIVHWDLGATRTVHFESCAKVYTMYNHQLKDRLKQIMYLQDMYELTVKYDSEVWRKYYADELKRIGWRMSLASPREALIHLFPSFYRFTRKTVNTVRSICRRN